MCHYHPCALLSSIIQSVYQHHYHPTCVSLSTPYLTIISCSHHVSEWFTFHRKLIYMSGGLLQGLSRPPVKFKGLAPLGHEPLIFIKPLLTLWDRFTNTYDVVRKYIPCKVSSRHPLVRAKARVDMKHRRTNPSRYSLDGHLEYLHVRMLYLAVLDT